MRGDELARLYYRLTPDERFKLFIEAHARGDEDECGRLEKCCPKRIYEMSGAAYGARVKASEEITILVCLDLAPRLAKVRMLMAFSDALAFLHKTCLDEAHRAYFRGNAAGSRRAWRVANRENDPPNVEEDDPETDHALEEITSRIEVEWSKVTDVLGGLQQDMLHEAKAMWEAFARFSRTEIGMGPEKLLKVWFEPMLPEIEKLKDISDPPTMDAEKLEEYESTLCQLWSELVT